LVCSLVKSRTASRETVRALLNVCLTLALPLRRNLVGNF